MRLCQFWVCVAFTFTLTLARFATLVITYVTHTQCGTLKKISKKAKASAFLDVLHVIAAFVCVVIRAAKHYRFHTPAQLNRSNFKIFFFFYNLFIVMLTYTILVHLLG